MVIPPSGWSGPSEQSGEVSVFGQTFAQDTVDRVTEEGETSDSGEVSVFGQTFAQDTVDRATGGGSPGSQTGELQAPTGALAILAVVALGAMWVMT
jgi:hypothetical protein